MLNVISPLVNNYLGARVLALVVGGRALHLGAIFRLRDQRKVWSCLAQHDALPLYAAAIGGVGHYDLGRDAIILAKVMERVDSPITLTQWLRARFADSSHTEIKQWLRRGEISVNGAVTTNGGQQLAPGDRVERLSAPASKAGARPGAHRGGTHRAGAPLPFPVIYEDSAIVVIDKPPQLLTVATESERHRTAYRLLSDHYNRDDKSILIVHRLDRETSGLLLFARTAAAKEHLQEQFRTRTAERRYIAIVEGKVEPAQGRLEHCLAENERHQVFVTRRRGEGKPAVLHYQVRYQTRRYSELEITLETGRRGQIRAQLAAIGHPIVGDTESRVNPLGRLGLHAHYLAVNHPDSGRRMEFRSELPSIFRRFRQSMESAS